MECVVDFRRGVSSILTGPDTIRISLSGLTLDLSGARLTGPSGDIALRPKSFALLCHLARNPGRVLSKDDLIAAIWPDVTVTEDSLTQCIRDIRRALGDKAAAHLRTVPRRGYLFATPTTAVEADLPDNASPHPGSIAVLPFACDAAMTPADQMMFDGLANDIITRLAGLRSFHVIARGSTFALRQHAADPLHAARLLNVAYVVSGSVAPCNPGFCLRIDMVNARNGTIAWTEDVAVAKSDIVAMIGTLTDRITNLLASEITAVESRRALTMPETSMDAWELYHRGLNVVFSFEAAKMAQALHFFDAATTRDPGFARAHAGASFCHYFFGFSGQCDDREAQKRLALLSSERAMQADSRNPASHWAHGRALWLSGDPEAGLAHSRQAVHLCPGFAHAHYMIGFIEAHHGDPHTALTELDRVEALSPFDPFLKSVQITRAAAYFRLGDIENAALWALRASRYGNAYSHMLCHSALILSAAGQADEARQIVTAIRAKDADYTAAELFLTLYGLTGDLLKSYQRQAARIGL
jgi:TolB-like protein/tetratricopeptide (TPR) repeat protein